MATRATCPGSALERTGPTTTATSVMAPLAGSRRMPPTPRTHTTSRPRFGEVRRTGWAGATSVGATTAISEPSVLACTSGSTATASSATALEDGSRHSPLSTPSSRTTSHRTSGAVGPHTGWARVTLCRAMSGICHASVGERPGTTATVTSAMARPAGLPLTPPSRASPHRRIRTVSELVLSIDLIVEFQSQFDSCL